MNLRLLLWSACDRACPGCCNKDWDLNGLQVAQPAEYTTAEQVLLTGGEPLLYPFLLQNIIQYVRSWSLFPQIIVYTAKVDEPGLLTRILRTVDGMAITLHDDKDVRQFLQSLSDMSPEVFIGKSMRLNVFPENFQAVVAEYEYTQVGAKLHYFKQKLNMQWTKDCPLPANEVFRRFAPA